MSHFKNILERLAFHYEKIGLSKKGQRFLFHFPPAHAIIILAFLVQQYREA